MASESDIKKCPRCNSNNIDVVRCETKNLHCSHEVFYKVQIVCRECGEYFDGNDCTLAKDAFDSAVARWNIQRSENKGLERFTVAGILTTECGTL